MVAGCGYAPCQVVVINQMPSAGMAQWYQAELMRRVQLTHTADLNNGSWRIDIREVRPLTRDVVQAADGSPLSKHLIDFDLRSSRSACWSVLGSLFAGYALQGRVV
jgi:hypothetical protein